MGDGDICHLQLFYIYILMHGFLQPTGMLLTASLWCQSPWRQIGLTLELRSCQQRLVATGMIHKSYVQLHL